MKTVGPDPGLVGSNPTPSALPRLGPRGTRGLEIRAAVHTGEVELVPGNLRGLAVHEAARILDLADAGEVLVSGTTRELASSAGLDFVDRGAHRLKGVPAERRVFALSPRLR